MAGLALAAVFVFGVALRTAASTGDHTAPDQVAGVERFRARTTRLYDEAKAQYAASTNVTLAWQFTRACFDLADAATNDAQRAAVAREGISVGRDLVRRQPTLAAAHYYLAMNLGQLARTRTLGALGIVSEMERVFSRARELNETFDYAGPDRCLGLLYRDAPGWPLSVGNRAKAETHLRRAVTLSPDYPENQLNWLESRLRWEDPGRARPEFETTARLLAQARLAFVGQHWEAAWADWDQRWSAVQGRMNERTGARTPPDNAR
jgi:tetratricopeptide (TPR) repeat protein